MSLASLTNSCHSGFCEIKEEGGKAIGNLFTALVVEETTKRAWCGRQYREDTCTCTQFKRRCTSLMLLSQCRTLPQSLCTQYHSVSPDSTIWPAAKYAHYVIPLHCFFKKNMDKSRRGKMATAISLMFRYHGYSDRSQVIDALYCRFRHVVVVSCTPNAVSG